MPMRERETRKSNLINEQPFHQFASFQQIGEISGELEREPQNGQIARTVLCNEIR
jgi:hypothetical protein